jgi:hypothetical protein
MATLLTFAAAINASSFGWSIASDDNKLITTNVLSTVFSLYLIVLTGLSVNQQDVHSHTKSIIHIASLATAAASLFCVAAIIPETTSANGGDYERAPVGLWYTTFGLYSLVFAISITRPLGPMMHYPPEMIYSEKITMAITNKDEENVCGVVGAFVPPSFDA